LKTKRKTIIIGCSSKKKAGRLRARDKYDGPWWTTLRKWDSGSARIFVLSAKYGLIPAERKISDYDSLLGRDVTDADLVKKIKRQLKRYRLKNIYVVTSKRYAKVLQDAGLTDFKFVSGGIGTKRAKLKKLL